MSPSPLDFLGPVQGTPESAHLKSLCQEKRLPPVILFHGKGSLAKSQLVARLCAYLLCETKEACGQCQECLAWAQNKNPSVLFLDNHERLISVEETLAIKKHLASGSGTEGDPRIVFIREVERLSEASTNKLLKAFEDLNPYTYVFMTTESRYSLLQTLLSRSMPYLLRLSNSEPLFKESVLKLAARFEEKMLSDSFATVYELCESLKKDQSTSLEEILEAFSLALNNTYKSLLKEGKLGVSQNLEKKRKHLALLNKTVLDQKIKLNKGLLLESLFLNPINL